ncbi:MAG: DNA translocase FtsK 4TM domain-containing protein [Phycisphaerae bacterium]|nr:DNA translocase FtsK 4TM domain-containing protein [Phycisphaerae bacterium]
MARKPSKTAPRASVASVVASVLPEAGLSRKIAWVVTAILWTLAFLALASFNTADWPSHDVSVHNEPAANLVGRLGAAFAYWAYAIFGIGVWIPVMLAAAALVVAAVGRPASHWVVRGLGATLMMLGFAGLHALWLPNAGLLTTYTAGAFPMWCAEELATRFGTAGASVVMLGALVLGAIVAIDELVFALPQAILRTTSFLDPVWNYDWAGFFGALRAKIAPRPEPAAAAVGSPAPRATRTSRRKDTTARDEKSRREAAVATADEETETEDDVDASTADEIDEDVTDEVEETDDVEAEEVEDVEDEVEDEAEDAAADEDEAEEEEEEEETAEKTPLTDEELRAKIAKLPVKMASSARSVARDEDIPREQSFEGYQFPTLELLEEPESNYSEKMEAYVREQARVLEQALRTFQIDGEVTGIESGPVVTLYSIELAPGTRVARLETIAKDLARSVQAPNIRIIPNMVGRTAVGIEVPNRQKEKVRLKELMSGRHSEGMTLPMFLGKDSSGEPLVIDLSRMPHMLIAGTTGSGKSVCMNTIIMSWLYTKRPDELKLVLVDPKMVEMSQFADIPHLMCPVVTEMNKAAGILEWAVNKMEERYELLKEAKVRDIRSYNELSEQDLFERCAPANDLEKAKLPKKLPYLVFVIDELADLMMTNKEVETSIVRIAQKARAVGIHLILATQRPQANVVTGLIKSNMPCRVSFKVASGMDSRIVLDQKGAELLLGQGDMLVLTPSSTELRRSQGTLVTDNETRKVAKFLKDVAAPTFERSLVAIKGTQAQAAEAREGDGFDPSADKDPLFEKAVEIIIESGRGSVSLLQRRLAIGYGRASRLVDQMGLAGILGEHNGSTAREVLLTLDEWKRLKAMATDGDDAGNEE